MHIDLTEKMIVELYESLSNKIVEDLGKKYNKKEKLIRLMINFAILEGYNVLEAKELIEQFEIIKKDNKIKQRTNCIKREKRATEF